MCGIGGILLPDDETVPEPMLRRMAEAMAHRGPDAEGTWRSAGVGFAHTRLSLFDLSEAGNQPWSDGTDALVFNGEIYNFQELRKRLEAHGAELRSTSDTEVLFNAIQQFGLAKALAEIRGMFAFAFYEARSATTYLCRDRYGIKPLLYCRYQKGIVFASELKAILSIADVEPEVPHLLLALRTLGDKSQTRTLFRDVDQVAPATMVAIRGGKVVEHALFDSVLDHVDQVRYRELNRLSFDDVCVQANELLEASVARMAACDAKLGTFLSGGVDSSLITAIGAAQGHGQFHSFTADVMGPASELSNAERVADDLELPLSVAAFRQDDWLEDWVRCTWHLETPVITHPSSLPFAQLAQLAHHEGFKAVLTGEGADELFLGYPRLGSRFAEHVAAAPLTLLRHMYRRVPGLADALLNERDSHSNDFLRGVVGGFEERQIEAEAVERFAFLRPAAAQLQARTVIMMQTGLLSLLQRNDRMGMAASIESRFPFLDEELVRFAVNLPTRFKLRRTLTVHDPKHPFIVDKAPVRAVASRYLAPDIARRKKNGFPTPGLQTMVVRSGAFRNSWVAENFGGGRTFDRQIDAWPQVYDVAKLMSIEIFGRLFGAKQSLAEVEHYVQANVVLAR